MATRSQSAGPLGRSLKQKKKNNEYWPYPEGRLAPHELWAAPKISTQADYFDGLVRAREFTEVNRWRTYEVVRSTRDYARPTAAKKPKHTPVWKAKEDAARENPRILYPKMPNEIQQYKVDATRVFVPETMRSYPKRLSLHVADSHSRMRRQLSLSETVVTDLGDFPEKDFGAATPLSRPGSAATMTRPRSALPLDGSRKFKPPSIGMPPSELPPYGVPLSTAEVLLEAERAVKGLPRAGSAMSMTRMGSAGALPSPASLARMPSSPSMAGGSGPVPMHLQRGASSVSLHSPMGSRPGTAGPWDTAATAKTMSRPSTAGIWAETGGSRPTTAGRGPRLDTFGLSDMEDRVPAVLVVPRSGPLSPSVQGMSTSAALSSPSAASATGGLDLGRYAEARDAARAGTLARQGSTVRLTLDEQAAEAFSGSLPHLMPPRLKSRPSTATLLPSPIRATGGAAPESPRPSTAKPTVMEAKAAEWAAPSSPAARHVAQYAQLQKQASIRGMKNGAVVDPAAGLAVVAGAQTQPVLPSIARAKVSVWDQEPVGPSGMPPPSPIRVRKAL